MKGDYEYLNITFALLIFMGTVVFIIFMIMGNILSFGGSVTSDINTIRAIEATHIVEYCLTTIDGGDSNHISSLTLDKYEGKSMKDICGIDKPDVKAEVVDLETQRKWEFPGHISKPDHEIWVSILYDNSGIRTINVGKLYVEI